MVCSFIPCMIGPVVATHHLKDQYSNLPLYVNLNKLTNLIRATTSIEIYRFTSSLLYAKVFKITVTKCNLVTK